MIYKAKIIYKAINLERVPDSCMINEKLKKYTRLNLYNRWIDVLIN